MEVVDLAIIGAGVFGLATARTYTQAHPDENVVILESAESLGGTWAKHRLYPGLKTNNVLGTYEFPDFPMETHKYKVQPWNHIPGTSLHEYLAKFAEHHDITRRLRFSTKVEVVEQGDNDDWILTLQVNGGASSSKLRAKKLVIATGMTGNPNLPNISGAAEFGKPLFHAKDFLKHEDLLKTADRVVVYGGAKSAWDAVYAYASSGVKVDWVMRESGRGPCWMISPFITPLKIWVEKLVFMRLLTWMSPCIWGANDGYEFIRNLLHTTILGQWIVSVFFAFLGNDTLNAHKYDAHPETAKLKPWSDAMWSGTSLSIFNFPTDFLEYVRNGTVKVYHADVVNLTPNTVHLSTGESITTDALHCSTGWKHEPPINLSPASLVSDLGLPHVASTSPSELALKADEEVFSRFPLLKTQPNVTPKKKTQKQADEAVTAFRLFRFMVPPKYIHKRNFAVAGAMLSLGQPVLAQMQGLWITSYLDGTLNIPDVEDAEYSTELLVRYGKYRTPAGCGDKHGDMVFETLPYYDQLLQDLGLPYKRKATWIQEILEPYGAADYSGIVDQWIKLKAAGKLVAPQTNGTSQKKLL